MVTADLRAIEIELRGLASWLAQRGQPTAAERLAKIADRVVKLRRGLEIAGTDTEPIDVSD